MKKPIIAATIVLLGLVAFVFYAMSHSGIQNGNSVFVVARGNIENVFKTTGQVKPKNGVDLAFERSGKVSAKYFNVGDKVSAGKTLVALENYDLVALLHQAEANLKIQQAKLDELKRGARNEDVLIQQSRLAGAESALVEAKQNAIDKIQDAYTKSDDAIRGKVDQFFSNPKSANPALTFVVPDLAKKEKLEFDRMVIETMLNDWYSDTLSLGASGDVSGPCDKAFSNLRQIKSFLDDLALVINALSPSSQLSQTTLAGWRADITLVRSNINTAISSITAAREKLEGAKMNYDIASAGTKMMAAGATPEQLRAQEGQVDSANAALESARAQLAKTIIRAPFSGEIAKDDVVVGQLAVPNVPLISIVSTNQFDIQTNIPESGISRVKVGDAAKVTLDAYNNNTFFDARIISIDSAQSVVDGVPVYRAKLQFVNEDNKIRAGMTANINIAGQTLQNVLYVPERSVFSREMKNLVFVVGKEGAAVEREVVAGARGTDGKVEIVSGVAEGETVLVY